MRILLGSALVLVDRQLVDSALSERLVQAVLPFLNAVQHPVRYRAVYCCAQWAKNEHIVGMLSPTTLSSMRMAADFYEACGDLSRKVIKAEEDWLERYLQDDPSFELIFLRIPCKCPEIMSESFVPDVLKRALGAFGKTVSDSLPKMASSSQTLPAQKRVQNKQAAQMARNLRDEGDLDFQVKRIPWHMLKLDEEVGRQAVLESARRLPMVVCASLLDRAPNLGGLTRTSEVFGLQSITVPDANILNSKEFLNVSVTAERWIKCDAVGVADLANWLLEMKTQGYALIGLEQSKDSVSLLEFQFPRKCVLLLGNELQGMPASYLSMLDHVVEIPQLGTIRSLNVHVAGSIMIAEYVKQQLKI